MKSAPISIAQVVTGTAAGLALLYFLRSILIPVVVAFVLAILVDALVRSIVRRSPKAPGWAIVAAAGSIIGGGAFVAIYILAKGGAEIVATAPALLARLDALVEQIGQNLGADEPVHLSTIVGRVSVPSLAGEVLNQLQGVVSGLFLMLVYFGFMLGSRGRIAPKVRNIAVASSSNSRRIKVGMGKIAADIETYVWVQTLTGLMLAGVSGALMIAVGLDNALFWTVILFLLSFIPIIGVTIGSVAPALFALLQFPTYWQAAIVFGGIQVAAFVVGNLIYPRMQADTQNIDPVATILALSFWGFLWGIPGAFLAVPLTLMLMMVCAQFDSSRWVAVLLSHDGGPNVPRAYSPRKREAQPD